MNYNRVIYGGNLTRDPEIRVVGESKVAKFSIALNNGYGERRKVAYIDCEAWLPGLVTVAEKFMKKGSNVLIEGSTHQDNWDKDGEKRSKLFCKVNEIRLCDKKADVNTEANEVEPETSDSGDVPF